MKEGRSYDCKEGDARNDLRRLVKASECAHALRTHGLTQVMRNTTQEHAEHTAPHIPAGILQLPPHQEATIQLYFHTFLYSFIVPSSLYCSSSLPLSLSSFPHNMLVPT